MALLQGLRVAMAGHRDRSVLGRGGVVERPLVVPSGSLVEGPGSCVAGDDREPGPAVSVRSHLALGLIHQDGGYAGSSVKSRDVHLLDLIVNDHDEACDGLVDGGNRSVADAFRRSGPERFLDPGLDQFLWDEPDMAVLPTEMPDGGDVICILRTGRP